jgi:hypothetical protein
MITGRRFRVLNIVDDVTRECLKGVPDTSISGKRVVRELKDLIAVHGNLSAIRGMSWRLPTTLWSVER